MTIPPPAQQTTAQWPWSGAPSTALERLPLSYRRLVVVLGIASLGGQIVEFWLRDPTFGNLARGAVDALAFLGPLIYAAIYLRFLKLEAVRGLAELRPAVLVSDAEYEAYARRALHAKWYVEVGLLIVSLAITLGLFFSPPRELITLAGARPGGALIVAYLVLTYALLGWLVLALVYTVIRSARGLGALARCPLAVNVFDTGNLLPFSRLSLVHSLSPIGLVLIPLILLGPPRQAGFLILALSFISLLLLIIPLWGVHRQISAAKERALGHIGAQLMNAQGELLRSPAVEGQATPLRALADRIEVLIKLRKDVLDSPNWPFRDVGAALRAIGAAISPLVYLVLTELIRAYLLPFLKR